MNLQLLNTLERGYGSAFYLFDTCAFRDNYRAFASAFRRRYLRSNIGYSYKANYIPWILQHVNAQGGYAEVVSRMEYELALRASVAPERIIINGPYKYEADIEQALLVGAIVNLDSPYELKALEALASRHPNRSFAVGLRCNFELGGGSSISRFGFDAHNGSLAKAVATVRRLPNCMLRGLHCHFSTRHRSAESFELRTHKMIELCRKYFPEEPPAYINIGGGFFSKMDQSLAGQFSCPIPNYEQYAEAVASVVADAYPSDTGPELIVEPGTAITADTMKFVARVLDIKTIRSRRIALVNGSIYNVKPTLHSMSLSMEVVPASPADRLEEAKPPFTTDVVGHTCMEVDVLYKEYQGRIRRGDFLVFHNVGAYTTVLKPAFINPCAPVVAYNSEHGTFATAKRHETPDDVFATYIFEHGIPLQ